MIDHFIIFWISYPYDFMHKIVWVADPEDDEMIDHGKRFSRAAPNLEFKLIEEET